MLTRSERRLGQHWSIRRLTIYLDGDYGDRDPAWVPAHTIRIGRERLRVLLHEHGISFQRIWTWKTSTDPAYDTKLDRVDEVMPTLAQPQQPPPDVIAAQRCERVRVRSDHHQRRSRPPETQAA